MYIVIVGGGKVGEYLADVLLKSGNCAALSASRPRDLIIMDGIINKKYFDDINNVLIEKGLTDLNSRG